ncbi:MAG: enoyl-CoA hydratase-related protein [Acidimicrobiia bacterium]
MDRFDLTEQGGVWTLTLADGENRLGSASIRSWHRALDEVAAKPGSVLVAVGTDRFWSTGLDLDEMGRLGDEDRLAFMATVDGLLLRILTAPFPTVAALNGHAYAGGALLALAFDHRIMRNDRGFFCLPSVDVGIPFTEGMATLITAKVPQPHAHDLVVTGRRITGDEAATMGIVHASTTAGWVLPEALDLATTLTGKDPATLGTVKRRLYPVACELLARSV